MKILRVATIRQNHGWDIEPSASWVDQSKYFLCGHERYGVVDSVLSDSARLYIMEGRWKEDSEHAP